MILAIKAFAVYQLTHTHIPDFAINSKARFDSRGCDNEDFSVADKMEYDGDNDDVVSEEVANDDYEEEEREYEEEEENDEEQDEDEEEEYDEEEEEYDEEEEEYDEEEEESDDEEQDEEEDDDEEEKEEYDNEEEEVEQDEEEEEKEQRNDDTQRERCGVGATTRSTTVRTRNVEQQIAATFTKLSKMGLLQHLLLTRSAETSRQVNLIDATLKRIARYLVWTHFSLFPELVFSVKALPKRMATIFSKHSISVAEYCFHLGELGYKPPTIYNHLLDIRLLRKWFCGYYSKTRVKSRLFRNATAELIQNFSKKKKKHRRTRQNLESMVEGLQLPSGDLDTHLRQVQQAVRREVDVWGLQYMKMINDDGAIAGMYRASLFWRTLTL